MIIQNLQKLVDIGEQLYAKVCTVHRVDQANKCCDLVPVDGSAELFEVPFYLDEADGLCAYPAENSHVLVVFINKHHACVCGVSQVDLMKLMIDQTEFSAAKEGLMLKNEGVQLSISEEGFLLKKDSETLRKLMEDLLKEIQAMVFTTSQGPTTQLVNAPKFQAIQTRFNNLLKDA
ncbi:MAG: hypothetical protein E6Q66_01175 [Pedobacter sp.]|nr:MAG: hypothetical protein E6Q66_01175 [Pedobacter sp.]